MRQRAVQLETSCRDGVLDYTYNLQALQLAKLHATIS